MLPTHLPTIVHYKILLRTTEYYYALQNTTAHFCKKEFWLQKPRWPQDGKAHFLFTAVLRKCIFQSRKGEPLTEAFLRFINPGINKHRRRGGAQCSIQNTIVHYRIVQCACLNCKKVHNYGVPLGRDLKAPHSCALFTASKAGPYRRQGASTRTIAHRARTIARRAVRAR